MLWSKCAYTVSEKIKIYKKSRSYQVSIRPLSSLRQFQTIEVPLKMKKNAFYFMLKAYFVLEIFKFFSRLFGYTKTWLDEKAKVNFKIYDVTGWTTNNYNTLIAKYLRKERQSSNEIWLKLSKYFFSETMRKMRQYTRSRPLSLENFL